MNPTTNLAPSAINGRYITALSLAGIAFLFHLGSIISHAVANDDDYEYAWEEKYYHKHGDYDYTFTPAGWAALILGTIALILWIIATPIAFCAGRMYLSLRGVRARATVGFAIAAWIIYGLNTINGIVLVWKVIAESATKFDDGTPVGWNVAVLIWALIEFLLMLTYVELARRKNEAETAPAQPYSPHEPVAQPYAPQMPVAEAEPVQQNVKEVVANIQKPDGSWVTKSTKTTIHPDGSKTVLITERPIEAPKY